MPGTLLGRKTRRFTALEDPGALNADLEIEFAAGTAAH